MTLPGYDPRSIERNGFALVPGVADIATVAGLLAAFGEVEGPAAIRRRGTVHAVRNLLEVVPPVRDLARSAAVRALVEPVLGAECFAVRGILFDKTPDANWKVAWHQDLTIAVRERRDVEGFGPWSEKAGIAHVQPPAAVLERMLTVRVHLDPCGIQNGPVQVIAGSHLHGRMSPEQVDAWREREAAIPCTSPVGGALVMRPLLLHASSPSTVPDHRHVVHLEFGAGELPGGLEWHGRW